MTKVELTCAVYDEVTVFPVSIARNAKVSALQEKIAGILSNGQHTVPPRYVTLYLARKKEGRKTRWMKHDRNVSAFLRRGVSAEYDSMLETWTLDDAEYFGATFRPAPKEIHVLVNVRSDKTDVKRQRVEETSSLAELWSYSELKLGQVPAPHQLAALLQKPVPFNLTLRDSVTSGGVFKSDAPVITCPELALLMDNFLQLCRYPPEATASENSWQQYYDALLRIPTYLCRDHGIHVQARRNLADKTGTTIQKKRPDFILLYKGLVLMRGEEKSSLQAIATARMELTSKMHRWNAMFYGDIPYILGYATSGDDLQVAVIERTDGPCRATVILDINIFKDRADTLKLFYNLAFLLGLMVNVTKRTYACDLQPFVPDENEKRRIVLLDGIIERTIKRTQSGGDTEVDRLKRVYETLQRLDKGSQVTHLQTVENVSVRRDGRLVVELSPIGYLRLPDIDEVGECLRQMLTALKFWHWCGYCHGDLRWRNIVSVPIPGGSYWVLIDMDESRPPNSTTIRWNHKHIGRELQFQHDLNQLGQLMGELPFKLSDDMKTMQAVLLSAVDDPEFTAEAALEKLEELISRPVE